MRLLVSTATAISMICVAYPAAAQDILAESVNIVVAQTERLQQLNGLQRSCIAALDDRSDWLDVCRQAKQVFFREVVQKDMSLYLETLGDYGLRKRDTRYLDLGNNLMFYESQARTLHDEAWNIMTPSQQEDIYAP